MTLYTPISIDDLAYSFDPKTGKEKWEWGGQLHSVNDHPAVKYINNNECQWYSHGLRHRDETIGPAWILPKSSINIYYNLGNIHRNNGPAWIDPNYKKWYVNDELHRTDGPAIEYNNGMVEWWWKGKSYMFDGWADISKCDPEIYMILKLKYG